MFNVTKSLPLDTFDPSPLSHIYLLCLSAMGDSSTVEE